jgi:ABC-2 type transport system ATP-binding protein
LHAASRRVLLICMHVELVGVSKGYGSVAALDDVSLEVAPGQIVALVGANGAGKTTLLRCLAAIAAPSSGQILYDSERFERGRLDLRRRLMFLPDVPCYFHEMTVLRHIGMALRLYGVERPGLAEFVVEALADFDLLPLAESQFRRLSRGQIYKAALVALVAVDPELWLFDEPLASGMDPHALAAFRRRAREAAARGRTVIYTTQLLDQAQRFADRVCVIHRGRVRAFERVEALQPAERPSPPTPLPGGPGRGESASVAEEGALETIFAALRAEER